MKFFYITLVLFLCSIACFGQTASIKGIVHLLDGTPVKQATVRIKGTTIASVSNEKGEYLLAEVPYGSQVITVTSVEVQTRNLPLQVDKSKYDLHIHIDPRGEVSLDEIRVTGNSAKREIETKGFAVNVIETKLAALQSIQTNELLDRSAGVRIRQDGGLGSHIHYNINGLSGNAVKVFIDGVPASNYGSSFSLNSIPPALIERIEIFKGVVPGYLSEDALGGAINVVMKKQRTRNSLLTSYSAGSFNTHQWNMIGSFKNEKGLGVDASAFYNYSDNNYEVWGENISFKDYTGATTLNQRAKRFHDAYRSYGGRVNFGYTDVSWADRFLIGGVLSRDYKEVQHGRTMNKPYGNRHTRGNSNVATLTYEKKDLLLEGLSVKLDASYSYLERQLIDTIDWMYDWRGKPIQNPDGSYVTYTSGAESSSSKTTALNSDKTLVSRVNLGYAINANNHLFANYLYNNFKRGTEDKMQPLGIQLLENTRDLQKNIFSFTYENLSFSQKLRTNIFYKHYLQKVTSNEPYQINANPPEYGLKKFERDRNHSGYGFAASYALRPTLFLLGSGEKAIRLPNANEIFGNVADNLLPPVGELNPEISYNANLGVNLGPYIMDKHMIRLNSSLIYRNTQGMIREGLQSGNNDNTRFENLEDVETRGIDAEIRYTYNQKLDFNFTISKISTLFNTEFNQNGDRYLFYRTQIRNEPSFKFNANLAYRLENLFADGSHSSIYYNVNYVEGFLRNWANVGGVNLDKIPTQYANDIGLTYAFPSSKVILSVDAKNIFNQQTFDNFGLQKPGRAFYAKITYAIF
ncbi:TonB-dependent receptor plug domain-containing protein [Sphingobacterium sp. BN32]|uniref:TonB-dependent receptor n=1 Tax=Sphingobacterium sp. BN32 TaxID=3058432 RepID=UPI00265D2309|nr:TonB-dependent receptor plug domain-containing protein [Sphingobacterium sp. BN32]WKK58791.1 TonB-dependent receptor plug domain-containing protein [Sphingobacterium sp. BN32]